MNKYKRQRSRRAEGGPGHPATDGTVWLYGTHAVLAALANPQRRLRRLVATPEATTGLDAGVGRARSAGREPPAVERLDRGALQALLPQGAVHQGLAALAEPLPSPELDALCERWAAAADPVAVVVLDQVTDPHNVGAVLRSAAAFGAAAVVLTERHAAPESGALAKAASGALEHVPLVRVVNLARGLDRLKEAGFWCIGLDAAGRDPLDKAPLEGRLALVLGSEGGGLRRLTREGCDLLAHLPTRGPIRDLNVSNAAAVALYEWARRRP
jgi:23S rRNA (guanosine2251-2'-O)-methyltransferase